MKDQTRGQTRVDFAAQLGAITHTVHELTRDEKPARNVTLARTYGTTPTDLWSAITDPDRLARWFVPVSGELKLGGRFQLKENAGGTILDCDPPRFLSTTWEYGNDLSWLEINIHPEADGAALTLSHICPINDHWRKYGPAAVGIGWDLSLLCLGLHLSRPDDDRFDEEAFAATAEGKATMVGLSESWRDAAIASGDDPTLAEEAARAIAAFYSGS